MESETNFEGFLKLDDPILRKILLFLDTKYLEFLTLRLVCRKWNVTILPLIKLRAIFETNDIRLIKVSSAGQHVKNSEIPGFSIGDVLNSSLVGCISIIRLLPGKSGNGEMDLETISGIADILSDNMQRTLELKYLPDLSANSISGGPNLFEKLYQMIAGVHHGLKLVTILQLTTQC
jgi:F-box domain